MSSRCAWKPRVDEYISEQERPGSITISRHCVAAWWLPTSISSSSHRHPRGAAGAWERCRARTGKLDSQGGNSRMPLWLAMSMVSDTHRDKEAGREENLLPPRSKCVSVVSRPKEGGRDCHITGRTMEAGRAGRVHA